MPNPAARRATARPMRPKPTMPRVFPDTSRPRNRKGAQSLNFPSRTLLSPSTTRRATARMSVKARSAVASVSTPGVLETGMPRRVAAAMSM